MQSSAELDMSAKHVTAQSTASVGYLWIGVMQIDVESDAKLQFKRLLSEAPLDDTYDYLDMLNVMSMCLLAIARSGKDYAAELEVFASYLERLGSLERQQVVAQLVGSAISHGHRRLAEGAAKLAPSHDDDLPLILDGAEMGAKSEERCTPVPVYFITSLQFVPRKKSAYHQFDQKLSQAEDDGDELFFGCVTVSVPWDRKIGYIKRGTETQEKTRRGKIPKCSKYVLSDGVERLDSDLFYRRLQASPDELGIFSHGWNQSFADAVIHAAQISADLDLVSQGAIAFTPVVLSWPSAVGYVDALENLDASRRRFERHLVLHRLCNITSRRRILIAHSMGCRLAVFLLDHLNRTNAALTRGLSRVVFASPDWEVFDYNRFLESEIVSSKAVTTFANEGDRMLKLATLLNPLGTPRAGLVPGTLKYGSVVDTGMCESPSAFRFPREALLRHCDFSNVAVGQLNTSLSA